MSDCCTVGSNPNRNRQRQSMDADDDDDEQFDDVFNWPAAGPPPIRRVPSIDGALVGEDTFGTRQVLIGFLLPFFNIKRYFKTYPGELIYTAVE